MQVSRLFNALLAGLLAAGLSMAAPASAQTIDGPVRVLVGFTAGGSSDIIARLMAEKMKDALGQPVIVENRAGAGGLLAANAVKAAPPDGKTILLTLDHIQVMLPLIMKSPGFDGITDFQPISTIAGNSWAFAVPANSPIKNMGEYMEWVKQDSTRAVVGIGGAGTAGEFALHGLGEIIGAKFSFALYKGGGPAVLDLVAGHIPAAMSFVADMVQQHRAGKIRVIGVLANKRSSQLPDVQLFSESGVKGLNSDFWFGFVAPAKTPASVVAQLNRAVQHALAQPDLRERLFQLGLEPEHSTPDDFGRRIRASSQFWAPVVKKSGWVPQ